MNTRVLFAMVVALVIAPACDALSSDSSRKNSGIDDPVVPTPTNPQDDNGARGIDVARPAFQAKSSAQLLRSIEACVGGAAIWVTSSMIVTPENQAGFLTTDFADGDDIIDVQKLLFDGNPESLRTGVRVDQISLEYITALKNVANVVGSRCANNVTVDDTLCACESEGEAKAMLTRCLTAVADPTTPEFAELTREFGAACKASRGTAIASMIASLAFAKVP
jgi:hypothetical protein